MEKKMTVGFIGLGAMGKPMARRIMEAGWPLVVYNRSAGATKFFVNKNVPLAASPVDLTQRSDIIITMLPGDTVVSDVAFRKNGIFAGMDETKILVDMSTTSPDIALQLESAASDIGARTVSAKVSGSVEAAAKGELLILAGGTDDALKRVRPVLLTMGKRIVNAGGHARANALKLVVNILLGLEMQALAEAYVLAIKAGLTSESFIEAVENSAMSSKIIKGKLKMIKDGDYQRRFGLRLMQKDLKLVLDEGDRFRVSLPATAATNEIAKTGLAAGLGRLDFAALYMVVAQMAGIKVEPAKAEMSEEPAQAI